MKRIKREKEELEERNQILMNEMRSCVKHFYPTSWKQSDQYSHSRIENWDHQTITKNAQERFYFCKGTVLSGSIFIKVSEP